MDQKLAWMIILATIPVGLVGLLFEHTFRVIFGKPVIAGIFLAVNGLILIAGERYRSRASLAADAAVAAEREPAREPEFVGAAHAPAGDRVHAAGRDLREAEQAEAIEADRRLARMPLSQSVVVGSAQILALLAGISRDGVTMVAGMARGLSREDAARFAFLLATPVILAAGALKIPDLLGPLGSGIRGQILLGSAASGVGSLPLGPLPAPVPADPDPHPVRGLLPDRRPGLRPVPGPGEVMQHLIATYGYAAIFLLMLLESACIPVPSELIMTFGGALAAGAVPGTSLNLAGVIIAGVAGNVAGSYVAWAAGRYGGQPALRRWAAGGCTCVSTNSTGRTSGSTATARGRS